MKEEGRQLAASKKTAKAVQKALKVMMENWTLNNPNFNKLIFIGKVGYGWVVSGFTNL